MKNLKLLLLAACFLLAGSAKTQQTTYNNFGEGHEGWDYNYGLGWTIAGDSVENQFGVEQAMNFEAEVGGFVTDIWVAISYVPLSSYPDTVFIRLAENPDDLPPDPANVMEEWIITSFSSWSQWNTPIHLVASNTNQLHQGHKYWLWAIAKEETWTMWCMNEDPAFTCEHTIRREGEDWLPISNETASAFRVDVSTGVGVDALFMADGLAALSQNYPNPFRETTTIDYKLEQAGQVSISVYDITGNEVITPVDTYQGKGEYSFKLSGSKLSPGLYTCRMLLDGTPVSVIRLNHIR